MLSQQQPIIVSHRQLRWWWWCCWCCWYHRLVVCDMSWWELILLAHMFAHGRVEDVVVWSSVSPEGRSHDLAVHKVKWRDARWAHDPRAEGWGLAQTGPGEEKGELCEEEAGAGKDDSHGVQAGRGTAEEIIASRLTFTSFMREGENNGKLVSRKWASGGQCEQWAEETVRLTECSTTVTRS